MFKGRFRFRHDETRRRSDADGEGPEGRSIGNQAPERLLGPGLADNL
jgi:hypothetical protein